MFRSVYETQHETHQDFYKNEIVWRGQFRLKVVHVLIENFNVGPVEFSENDVPYFEREYVSLRYTAKNGRVRYVDWEHNSKDWI